MLTIFYKPSENVVKNVNENVVLKINEPSVTELMIPFSVNMNPPVILNSLSLTAESTSVGAMGSLIIHAWPQISVDKISPQMLFISSTSRSCSPTATRNERGLLSARWHRAHVPREHDHASTV